MKRDIAYSIDACVPGVYVWAFDKAWRIGGSEAESGYSGQLKSNVGAAIVLPNYVVLSTDNSSLD